MERQIDLKEISDGKLYDANDMVKAGCDDCKGCWACCQGMGESILLDPYDIYRLTTGLSCAFEELLSTCIELHLVDGVILPNMKMVGNEERCPFLNGEGRCNIHPIRPGICRLFPLGRCYEDGTFRYFLQTKECKKELKTKVKIKKWIDIPDLKRYDNYICQWHDFRKELRKVLKGMEKELLIKKIHTYVLEQFFRKPWDEEKDFYQQFELRMKMVRRYIGIL